MCAAASGGETGAGWPSRLVRARGGYDYARQTRFPRECPNCAFDLTGNTTGICPLCQASEPIPRTLVAPARRAWSRAYSGHK